MTRTGQAEVVYAIDECSRCGKDMRATVDNRPSMESVEVYCSRCGHINTIRDFEPVRGRPTATAPDGELGDRA